MTLLALTGFSVLSAGRRVVSDVDLIVREGEFVGLLGPNGAGKTSLLRGALGLLDVQGHSSLLELDRHSRARHAAWMPQERTVAWPISAESLVRLGRLPHGGRGTHLIDERAVDAAFRRTGTDLLRGRKATEVSGGELARLLIARLVAQETPLILADEPIAGLDPAAQLQTMQLLAELARQGRGLMVSLHDLGLAARFCTRLVLLKQGAVMADGRPELALSDAAIADVFSVSAYRADTPYGPIVQPIATI